MLDRLQRGHDRERIDVLRQLEAFKDHGLVDLGLLVARLANHHPLSDEEAELAARLHRKAQDAHRQRSERLRQRDKTTFVQSAANWVEGWIDHLDAIFRARKARSVMADLAHRRVSTHRAAVLMRELYAREKGGWLAKALQRRRK
jgi:hypothetical protein